MSALLQGASPARQEPRRPLSCPGYLHDRAIFTDHLVWAVYYARCGWRVFPVIPGGKTPAIRGWPERATTDEAEIGRWWGSTPDFNIGVATGVASDLYVIDVDLPDGEFSLETAECRHGLLPPTVQQRTGSAGRQLLFRCPGDRWRNTAGLIGPNLDTRGEGGFVVLPPSLHPSGERYAWTSPENVHQAAELPEMWRMRLEKRRPVLIQVPIAPSQAATTRAEEVLEEKAASVAGAAEGSRNHELYKSACRMAGMALAGLIKWDQAKITLARSGLAAGLGELEVARTLASAEKFTRGAV